MALERLRNPYWTASGNSYADGKDRVLVRADDLAKLLAIVDAIKELPDFTGLTMRGAEHWREEYDAMYAALQALEANDE